MRRQRLRATARRRRSASWRRTATVLEPGRNLGFAAGCDAARATGIGRAAPAAQPRRDRRRPASGTRSRRRCARGAAGRRGWASSPPSGGTVVNTEGGVVHFTGIAWAGGAGRRRDPAAPTGRRARSGSPPAPAWRSRGRGGRRSAASPPDFFLYHEDVDLSLRRAARGAAGWGSSRGARVDHEYEFDKGPAKWRHMERNRWATIDPHLPGRAAGAARARRSRRPSWRWSPVSIAGGWFGAEARSPGSTSLRWLPRLLRERREIRRGGRIAAAEFAAALTAELDSPYLGARWRASRPLRWALRAYWSVVRALLPARLRGLAERSPAPAVARLTAVAVRPPPRAASRSSASSRATSWARIFVSSDSRRGGDREVQQEHERDAERGQEQRVRGEVDPDEVRRRAEEVVPDREHEQHHGDDHPQQRVALRQPAAADQLQDHQQHQTR